MTKQEQWKEEFDGLPVQFFGGESFIMQFMAKSFISSLLAAQRAEMVEAGKALLVEVGEKAKCLHCGEHIASGDCDCKGYNRGINKVLALLSGEGK